MKLKTRLMMIAATLIVGSGAVFADDYFLTPRRTGNPGYQYFPSPGDWRDVNMYQLFTDRFSDGNAANNNVRGWYTTDGYRHYAMGGDWKGIRNKLDYLQGMGVNAIWISGVQINEQGSDTRYAPYHAYHPTDFYRVEPMFGTFQELKDLVDDAHSRGIYIILDVVVNHMADLNGLGGGKDDNYYAFGGGDLYWWNGNKKHAWPLDNLAYFHNNGKILNWSDSGQILNGAFVGTDDLKTEDSFVQSHLLAAFKNLIEATDCDGFRVDAIKHVEKSFIMSWSDTMRKHAAFLGKNNFLLFGENFVYDDNAVAEHCKDQGYAFNSALYFPMQLTLKEVFAWEQATSKLQDRLNNIGVYGEGAQNLVTFMDNHDVDRIALECGDAWLQKLKPALTFLYTGTPVPCLFYGTEHGFNQGGTRNNGLIDGDYQREVMFNYGYQPGNAWGDKFYASELYNFIKKLNELRKTYPCITKGAMVNRWQDTGNKGLFAYTRTLGDQEVLVAFNTDWSTKTLSPQVGKPNGTVYVNLLDESETITVSGGKLNNISIGSKGSKIFFAGNSKSKVETRCTRSNITITYTPNKGPLENPTGGIVLSVKNDGGAAITNCPMTQDGNTWFYSYSLSNATNNITFWFRDQGTTPIYDNNDGTNWNVVTKDCWKTGVNLAFVGNITTWPAGGELDPGEDLWINLETWPKNAAFEGEVVYSADNATWFTMEVSPNGTAGNNDAWHANLGQFPRNANIQFAVKMVGENGDVWNSNGGSNYWMHVNSTIVPVNWVGNTYHWPSDGDIGSTDDIWINVESKPLGAGVTGTVVYSSNGGSNWTSRALSGNGSTTNSDMWHVNIGKFAPLSTVRFAVMVADEDGAEMWDNNGGADFTASVNAAASSVEWYGNARHRSVLPPSTALRHDPSTNRLQLLVSDLDRDVTYSVFRSADLSSWSLVDTLVGWFTGDVLNLASTGAVENAGFYFVRADHGPADAVSESEQMIVSIETRPAGGATGANIVFTADGGAHWGAKDMMRVGTANSNDVWSVNLGSFAQSTHVKYAVEVVDGSGSSFWDNNGASDYETVVVP